jgi:PAS domain S-box-containing protein
MTDQEKRKIVLKLLAEENAKGRLLDDISRRSLNERSIGAGQFRPIPSKKEASESVKESEQAVASATKGACLWDIHGATSPSGKAFTRAFDLAHAMVRDLDGRICFWSSSMQRLYGWSSAEALGRVSHDLLKTEFPKQLDEINAELLSSGHWLGELRHRTRDSRTIAVSSHWVLDRDEAGRAAWIIELNNDISVQKATEELLRSNAAELKAILNAVPTIVWIAHDTQCRSIEGSRASYELLRLPAGANPSLTAPESERPVHFKVLVDGRELAAEDLPVQRAARGETIEGAELQVVFSDGTSRWIFGNAVPLFTESGQPRGAVSAFVDITDRKRAEAAIRAKDVAEQANEAKSEFLAMVSHEIRTPMTTVVGVTELLLRSNLTPRQRHQTARLKHAGEMLLALVNNILDSSKMEAGKLELEQVPLVPSEIAETALAIVQAQAEAKQIELRRELAADLPTCIKGDPMRLRQILLNLLSNAVKFTERGSITMRVSRELSADAMRLRFEVADTGIGIDMGQQDRLFQRFSQLGRGSERPSGTGLGLAISRQLVEAMGGTIGVKSRTGEGSVFWFAIPYEEIQFQAKMEQAEPALTNGSRGRILVAEDQYTIRKVMEEILKEAGYEVVLVGTGAEAIEALKRSKFEMVLMDVKMPQMGGIEATRYIRQMDERVRNVPIILLTAYAMARDAERFKTAGADEHLAKPIMPDHLLAIVEQWMANKMGSLRGRRE